MMQQFNSVLLVVHVVTGTLAVLVGVVALVARKPVTVPEALLHRRAGRLFMWLMAAVLGTAVGMTVISLDPYFAGLTASASLAVFSGWRVLGRKRPDVHPSHRATLLDWSVTLLMAAVAVYLLHLLFTGGVTRNLPVVRALAVGTLGYAAWDSYRFVFPTAFPFSPRLWLYEHLVKMIGGYFAAVAAFSGSVLVLFPEPWRQLWATFTGQTLAVVLVIFYAWRHRQKMSAVSKGA